MSVGSVTGHSSPQALYARCASVTGHLTVAGRLVARERLLAPERVGGTRPISDLRDVDLVAWKRPVRIRTAARELATLAQGGQA